MTPLQWVKAGVLAYKAWTGNKVGARLFPRWAERRARKKAEREARRKAERTEISSEGIEYVTEGDDMKLLEKIAQLRTSTKSGAVGLLTLFLMSVPFAEQAEAYLQQACQNPEGVIPFVIGGGVTWLVMYVTARFSKTPESPGKL